MKLVLVVFMTLRLLSHALNPGLILSGCDYFIRGGVGANFTRALQGWNKTFFGSPKPYKNITIFKCIHLARHSIAFNWDPVMHECHVFLGLPTGGWLVYSPPHVQMYARLHGYYLLNTERANITWPAARSLCLETGGDITGKYHKAIGFTDRMKQMWMIHRISSLFIGAYHDGEQFVLMPDDTVFTETLVNEGEPGNHVVFDSSAGFLRTTDNKEWNFPVICWMQ